MRRLAVVFGALAAIIVVGSCGGASHSACLNYVKSVNACNKRGGNTKNVPDSSCDNPTWNKAAVYDCLAALYDAGNCASDLTMLSITDGEPGCYKKELQ